MHRSVVDRRPVAPSRASRSERFNRYALLKAQAKEYVRHSQARLILQPLAERWLGGLGRAACWNELRGSSRAAGASARTPGYAAGNVLNLLLHLGADLRGCRLFAPLRLAGRFARAGIRRD